MADRDRAAPPARGGIRARTTAIAVLAVGLTLAVASLALVLFVRASLRENAGSEARVRARELARELATDGRFTPGDVEEEFVQLVGADGAVVGSSPNVVGEPAVLPLPVPDEAVLATAPIPDVPVLVLSRPVTVGGRPTTLLVGRSLEVVDEATDAIVRVLVVALPLVLLVVGGLTWVLVGRVLAPVEAIRREVEAISPSELHRRVPDPAGRDEIARLAGTMNAMLERLEEGRRRERRLVSDASHELRSPIASIREHAEVTVAHPATSEPTTLATTVLQEALRLQRIVDDLLLLSTVDEGSVRFASEAVDLDDLLLEDVRRLREQGAVQLDASRVSAGRVLGDRSQLERLIRNLTDNAARHARSTVRVALREADGSVVLVVEDDGPGVPPGDRQRVFERFVRLDEARDRASGGSGLGLAIVLELAERHGATVSVGDGDLGGARFVVTFPALAEAPPTPGSSRTFSERSGPDRQALVDPDEAPGT